MPTIFAGEQRFECKEGEDVLCAARRAGVKIAFGCRGGGCGVCRVRVNRGDYETGPMSKAHVGDCDRADGFALACRLLPRGDLQIEIVGKKPKLLGPLRRNSS